ncbi:type II secretion system F family protein [Propioniciclava sp. MC1683]|jgi:pilus assembly protein TadC|uniref:type II secretion system F family protein n=1 Tax=Propioniciclava sp. MC1683 TaxID=2760309 RepID=UPI0016017C36|nr:type II secretion system F family protein [Propioniciclava sp. MC1683]MBB1501775.1 type II secretion system F family protein [Propioniciclava sp. MC1683]
MVGLAAVAAALAVWWAVPVPSLARLGPERRDRWSAWAAGVLDGLRAVLPRRAAVDRDRALRASVPQVCDLLAVCLDAGRPTRTALRVVASVLTGPVADELRGVLQRIELGLDEAEAWASLSSVAGYREVGRDLARSVRSGLGLAGLLRQHAADARREAAAEDLVRARAAGVKSVVPLMVCFLPAFIALGVVPLFGSLVTAFLP